MRHLLLSLGVIVTALGGCTIPVVMGTEAATIVVTKPGSKPPADTEDQISPHESWCYQTMGNTECYAHIQDVPPERLVNVDPQNRYPVDLSAYHQALAGNPPTAASTVPTSLTAMPATNVEVEKKDLNDEIGTPQAPTAVSDP